MLKHSLKTGISFGLTSGTITTLGLMVGLAFGTHSRIAVIGGILTIAIADAFSDALGIHVSEESENVHSQKEVWESTIATFLTKFIFAITFIVPVLFLPLLTAVTASALWGFSMLSIFSFNIGRGEKEGPWRVVFEHLVIAAVVIVITYYVGTWIAAVFG